MSKEDAPAHVESSIESEEATARWLIRGISRFSTEKGEFVLSGQLLELMGARFGLKLYWGSEGGKDSDPEWCSLYAYHLNQCLPPSLRWKACLAIVNQHGGENKSVWTDVVDSLHHDRGFTKFKKRSAVLGTDLVKNDTLLLSLQVECWLQNVQTVTKSITQQEAMPGNLLGSLSEDLRSLWQEGESCDVVLTAEAEGSETVTLHAHRAILCARSPVFRGMLLSSGMREATPGSEVTLVDTEPKAANWFLEFLYTGKINEDAWKNDEALCHMLALAHKYEVRSLLNACETEIAARLCEETAAERLMMADLLGIAGLRAEVLSFMCCSRERLAKVQGTEAFKRLGQRRPQLLLDIMAKVVPPSETPLAARSAARKRSAGQCFGAGDMLDDLDSMTVVQLKQHCVDRGLPTSGSKQVLIQRLNDLQRERT
eukprot:TRINITY_DN105635_c0_g1_i1.p1 TRINITY_DN105635_c0_g1~~TRINITY_DN105635_c0_g1_i1.p1  ORF type:complete len:451 (+),score=81.17 TRINITY_DN105635_c0_g1_i1:72-1355(+)